MEASEYKVIILDFILVSTESNSKTELLGYYCRYIDMAETLCQKRALEAFRLDPAKWGGKNTRETYL